MTFRSRRLLDYAHEAPCFADFPHRCTQHEGCEPAHSDSHIFGRGHGHKSSDWAFASLCHEAHKELTAKVGDKLERETKFYAWLRAYAKTQEWLWTEGKVRTAG